MTQHDRKRIRPIGQPFVTRSEVMARRVIAATGQSLATQPDCRGDPQSGRQWDRRRHCRQCDTGGNRTHGMRIGGDLFAIIWIDRENKLYGLNASGKSPAGLELKEFQRRNLTRVPVRGPLSDSVPGAVDGSSQLQQRFGRLALAELLEPAVHYAREGFPVNLVIAHIWAKESRPLREFANFSSTFRRSGEPPRPGQIFRNADLASTLKKIQKEGRDGFYSGELAGRIVAFCKNNDYFLDLKDLQHHTCFGLVTGI